VVKECYTVITYNPSLQTKPNNFAYSSNYGQGQCLDGKCGLTWLGLKECGTNNTFLTSGSIMQITALTMNVGSTFRIPTLLAISTQYFSNSYEFAKTCFQLISPGSTLTLPQTNEFGEEWVEYQDGFRVASSCSSPLCSTCYTGTTSSPLVFVNESSNNVTVNYKYCNGTSTTLTINAGQTVTNPVGCHNVVAFMNAAPASGQIFFSGGSQTCT
jgi:hypothetical protein